MEQTELSFGEYPEGKTNYQIYNENGEKTTISLEKWVADILQIELDDVHARTQTLYNKICEKHSYLSRRQKGNAIRQAAIAKANEFQKTKKKILGWNDEDWLIHL